MGIRKPAQEPKGRVVGGWGSRSVDLTTQRYDPRGVTFHCTSVHVCSPYGMSAEPYCGQDRNVPDTKPAVAEKTKAPHKRGFNRGLLRGLGAEGGPLSPE